MKFQKMQKKNWRTPKKVQNVPENTENAEECWKMEKYSKMKHCKMQIPNKKLKCVKIKNPKYDKST